MTKAIDRFAGSGWGVALKWLGIEEDGVEIMPEAIATREAAGMRTIFNDVWDGLEGSGPAADIDFSSYDVAIDSPPCQTFSVAGNGTGRQALNEVMTLIEERAYEQPSLLREFGEKHDPRTALVLTPLAYAYRDRTPVIVLEQVPPVLPVWEAYAVVLRSWGYSVWTGILNAEQYGVPQTRRRAILIAKLEGEAKAPTPTHSRYYSRTPEKLDAGVEKWVSMAEALGFGDFEASKRMGSGMVERYGERPGRLATEPAFTLRGSAGGMEPGGFILRSNYGTGGDPEKRGERSIEQPAATVTSKAGRAKWDGTRHLTHREAAVLQSYPAEFPFQGNNGKRFLQIGNAVPPLLGYHIIKEAIS